MMRERVEQHYGKVTNVCLAAAVTSSLLYGRPGFGEVGPLLLAMIATAIGVVAHFVTASCPSRLREGA